MHKTPIEWTTFAANPIKFRNAAGHVEWGCVHVSDGCRHCYAETLAKRYGRGGPFTARTMEGLTPFMDETEERHMVRAKTVEGTPVSGSRCFVGDMTDVFGEWVHEETLDRLFAIFALRPDVTWQVLTKRADRMHGYIASRGASTSFHVRMQAILTNSYSDHSTPKFAWPLPNVWLGVSCEDQKAADSRIPHLLDTPAAVRFISAEPLLGPIDLERGGFALHRPVTSPTGKRWPGLDWVIVGGESGPTARPCDVGWIAWVVQQCRDAGVAVFVKQLGASPVIMSPRLKDWPTALWTKCHDGSVEATLRDRKGGTPAEWPDGLRIREFPLSVNPGSRESAVSGGRL
jgi:protein gp37